MKAEQTQKTIVVSKCMEFRINPTDEQKILIWKTFGCSRFVWNHLLDERISFEKMNKGKLLNTTPAHLKKDNTFLCEVETILRLFTRVILRTMSNCRNSEESASSSTVTYRTAGR